MHHAFRSFVVGLMLALTSIFAVAQTAQCLEYSIGFPTDTWFKTRQAACEAGAIALTDYPYAYTCADANFQPGKAVLTRCNTVNGNCLGTEWGMNSRNGDCNNCKSGQVKTVNFTTGWTRTGSTADVIPDSDFVGKVSMPGLSYKNSCVEGCMHSIGVDATTSTYVSTSPSAQGLYRNSVDALIVGTGLACTPGTDPGDMAVKPDPAPAPCPGFVGQVNGKTTCVGTASNPLPKPSGDLDSAARNLNSNGDNGNPVAGPKPASGEGSGNGGVGRTPGTGVGTASGGPIEAAAGGKGSSNGTVNKPVEGTEQQNCGAPGQPKCVIDETGTPTGEGTSDKFGSQLDKLKTDSDAALAKISGSDDKGMFESWRNMLTSAPPVAACQVFVLPREMGSINPCPVVDGVRLVMGYLWALAAFWLCVRMVKKVI